MKYDIKKSYITKFFTYELTSLKWQSGGLEMNFASDASGRQKTKQNLVGNNVLSTGKKNTFERQDIFC